MTIEYAPAGTTAPLESRVSHVSVVELLLLALMTADLTSSSRTGTSETCDGEPIPLASTRAVTGPVTLPRVARIATAIDARTSAPAPTRGEDQRAARPQLRHNP
ncbi:MAG: hypothetical protein M3O64_00315 [Chloroflexota bacterium]|nr:hypothetical protein [Chloroflexota bacterium]